MGKTITSLLSVFLPLSFLSVGGGQAIIAEVQRQSVIVHHWLTRTEFVDIFAISRMAPGPGSLFITLIGWHVGGFAGAAAATFAIFAPTIVITYLIAGIWPRFENARWRTCLEAGLKPVAAGLVLASVYVLLVNLNGAPWTPAIALASTAMAFLTRVHPLILLAGGSAIVLAAHQFALV